MNIWIQEKGADRKGIPEIALDAIKAGFPLLLRRWQPGDYFYPQGMGGKRKKVKKFLNDKKLSMIDKQQVYVLESNGMICMILGHAVDDRFTITADTTNILCIEFMA